MISKAYEIAKKAHENQVDKGGKSYIEHPLAVADMMRGDREKIVALLHDTVEDSDLTLEDLRAEGFDDEVIVAVDCITKRETESYESYIGRLCESQLAIKVKLADMTHNMDISRIPNPTEKDYQRVEKYKQKTEELRKRRAK